LYRANSAALENELARRAAFRSAALEGGSVDRLGGRGTQYKTWKSFLRRY